MQHILTNEEFEELQLTKRDYGKVLNIIKSQATTTQKLPDGTVDVKINKEAMENLITDVFAILTGISDGYKFDWSECADDKG